MNSRFNIEQDKTLDEEEIGFSYRKPSELSKYFSYQVRFHLVSSTSNYIITIKYDI